MSFWSNQVRALREFFYPKKQPRVLRMRKIYSPTLEREIDFDIYLPPDYRSKKSQKFPLLLLNDGQDLPRMDFENILADLWARQLVPSLVAVGIYPGSERMNEYGTARQADYKGRGGRAPQYKAFIINELLPYLKGRFRLTDDASERAIAGFSLGGLSAFDIGFDRPDVFGGVGVFSGALWWRWAVLDPRNPDGNRIIHDVVDKSGRNLDNHNQIFWMQTGTLDEPDDRNNNGVIDAIDDTLDLIRALKNRGCHEHSIRYLEIENGTHDPQTWGVAMPDFLRWTFSLARNFD